MRFWRWLGLLLAIVALPVHAAGPRLVAIGDLHGDFAAWRQIARAAALIDDKGRWIGGKTIFVQTGDVVDRGPNSLGIVQDLMRLQREARKAGGQVITLVGNHEAMNVTDDLRYLVPEDYAAFTTPGSASLRDRVFAANEATITAAYRAKDPALTPAAIKQAWLAATPLGQIEHQQAWHPTGRIGEWVVHNPAVVLIDGTLFVHGGISAAYAGLPIAELNQRVAAALTARDTSPGAIINDQAGPLWYRGLVARAAGAPASPTIDEELALVLKAYGAQRLVIAHTPILNGIAIEHDGWLIRIDTGISAYYGGTLSYLEIIDGKAVPHALPRAGTGKGAS